MKGRVSVSCLCYVKLFSSCQKMEKYDLQMNLCLSQIPNKQLNKKTCDATRMLKFVAGHG